MPHIALIINNRRIKVENVFTRSSRIMIMNFSLGSTNFRIENIYVSPDRLRRKPFLKNWTPSDNHSNYFLVGDFNLNLYLANRLNSKPEKPDPSKSILQTKLIVLADMQVLVSISFLQTFLQRVKGGRLVSNKIDYIFVSQDLSGAKTRVETKAGNSDHLLLLASISTSSEFVDQG